MLKCHDVYFIFMSVFVHRGVYRSVKVWMHVYVETRGQAYSSILFHLIFKDAVSCWPWTSMIQTQWLANELQVSTCLPALRLPVDSATHSFYRAARDLNSRHHVCTADSSPAGKDFHYKKENNKNFDKLGFASNLISCFKGILITLYKINSKT